MRDIRWSVLIPTVLLILVASALVVLNLDLVQATVDSLYSSVSHTFSWLFVGVDVLCVIFAIWCIFGSKANVRLGGGKPEYGLFPWLAMMFTTACSAGLVLFGFIEPIYYASNPPFEVVPFSDTAYETAMMYAHHHWGIAQWAIYLPPSIAIGFLLYNRKMLSPSVASTCVPVLGRQTNGVIGKIVDIASTFGVVVAPVTSMGLGIPLVIMLIMTIFGIGDENYIVVTAIVLLVWFGLFFASVMLGLNKGIKNLSKANVVLAFAFMGIVALLAGVFFVLRGEISSLGMYLQNIIRMDTYTDPYGSGDFVASWTVWYWVWLIVYMPLMGMLTAKVSRGRTVREIALGLVVACSLGCFVAIMTLGNYSIEIQQSGAVDIAAILASDGQAAAILAIVQTMPFPFVMMALLAIICCIFMATTVDSSSFVAAELTYIHNDGKRLAPRLLRVLWASITGLLAVILLAVGGFSAVQTLALLIGLPLAIVLVLIIVSTFRMLRRC